MKVYLAEKAGVAADRYNGVSTDFPLRVLLTTAGTVKRRARCLDRSCSVLSPADLFVDSGVFAIVSRHYKRGESISVGSFENKLKDHLGACYWMYRNGCSIAAVAEMDAVMYPEYVVSWREQYMFPFQSTTNIPIVVGWHGTENFYLLLLDNRVRYVGTSVYSGKRLAKYGISEDGYYSMLRDYVLSAYDAGVMVHGYAATSSKVLRRIPFYSVDSTSWQSSVQFGMAGVFDSKAGCYKLRDVGRSDVRKVGAKKVSGRMLFLRKRGSNLSPLDVVGREKVNGRLRPDYKKLFVDQAKQFYLMEQYYTNYWKLKGIDWEKQLSVVGR